MVIKIIYERERGGERKRGGGGEREVDREIEGER